MPDYTSVGKCPVCERMALITYLYPIKYHVCRKCKCVFVFGSDGTLSCLDEARGF